MILSGRALRLTVLVGENDIWRHKPVSSEVVHRAHRAGLAGAGVVVVDEVAVHRSAGATRLP